MFVVTCRSDCLQTRFLIHLVLHNPTCVHEQKHFFHTHALCLEIRDIGWNTQRAKCVKFSLQCFFFVRDFFRANGTTESTRPPLPKMRRDMQVVRAPHRKPRCNATEIPTRASPTLATATRLARTTMRNATMAMSLAIATSTRSLEVRVTKRLFVPKTSVKAEPFQHLLSTKARSSALGGKCRKAR